jgi:hypothetical protein
VDGLPEAAQPCVKLQLSSPIEEAMLTETFDSLVEDTSKMVAVFRGVEINQATLAISAFDADIPLGNALEDLGPVTNFDAMDPQKAEYLNDVFVKIVPDYSDATAEPVCTVQLRLSYLPSNKDRREELYEQLNKTTQRKSQAVNKLRQEALAAGRQGVSAPNRKPAIKPGFLNKPVKEPSRLYAWFDRYLGSDSLVQTAYPMVKNYVIFFGVVGFFHFQGQLCALPPPV